MLPQSVVAPSRPQCSREVRKQKQFFQFLELQLYSNLCTFLHTSIFFHPNHLSLPPLTFLVCASQIQVLAVYPLSVALSSLGPLSVLPATFPVLPSCCFDPLLLTPKLSATDFPFELHCTSKTSKVSLLPHFQQNHLSFII